MKEQLERLQIKMGTDKALRISLEKQILIEEKLRKFAEQQLKEKDKKIMSLEKQLEGEKATRSQAKKDWEESIAYWVRVWVQTSTELEALKINFNDCQEKANMSLKTQAELENQIKQYEKLYKKHVMLESELAGSKAKGCQGLQNWFG